MMWHRERTWKCLSCRHRMNASGNLAGMNPDNKPPVEGDITVCINCAAVYFRRSSFWRLATPEDWQSMTEEERQDLVKTVSAITTGRKN